MRLHRSLLLGPALAAVVVVSGCAAFQLEVAPVAGAACAESPPVAAALASHAAAISARTPVFAPMAPAVAPAPASASAPAPASTRVYTAFSGPPPSMSELTASRRSTIRAAIRAATTPSTSAATDAATSAAGSVGGSAAEVDRDIRAFVPGALEELAAHDDAPEPAPETAQAAIDLWQELSAMARLAQGADAAAREALARGEPTADSDARAVAAVSDAKGEAASRLTRALLTGGDDVLVTFTAGRAVEATLAAQESAVAWSRARGDAALASRHASHLQVALERRHDYQAARFLRTYLQAYFRNGRVFSAELKVAELVQRAMAAIESQATAPLPESVKAQIRDGLTHALGAVCRGGADACYLNGALGEARFVTRSGDSIQFKGVTLALGVADRLQATWDYPKSAEFAPQLMRVVVEALFDAMEDGRVPAVASATACTTSPPLFPSHFCVKSPAPAAASPTSFASSTPFASSTSSASSPPSAPDLQDLIVSVDTIAAKADSLATTISGELIRGGYFLSLNNEAVAKTVENFFGVTARKLAERAAWQRVSQDHCVATAPALIADVRRR